MPTQSSLFCCKTNAMSSTPSLSLSQLLTWESVFQLNATHPTDHSHLCSLKCHHVFFPYRPGLTSMQHAASHTAAVQPSSHNQRHVLIGKQWYQLPELIPTNSNSKSMQTLWQNSNGNRLNLGDTRITTCDKHIEIQTPGIRRATGALVQRRADKKSQQNGQFPLKAK